MRHTLATLIMSCILLITAGCGQTGPLYVDDTPQSAPAPAVQAPAKQETKPETDESDSQ